MWSRRSSRAVAAAAVAVAAALAGPPVATADDGPARRGGDPCNGTDAFGFANVVSRDFVDAVVAQNPGARRRDGTVDPTKVHHAHVVVSGHLAVQVESTPGHRIARATLEVNRADPYWSLDSTDHPGYVQAAQAQEDPARDADSDSVLGGRFVFAPATDIFPDGNMVARLRAFDAAGAEMGRLCIDATLANGLDEAGAARANTDAAFEPAPVLTSVPAPQPIAWFPGGEPSAAQRDGYAPKTLRLEFTNALRSLVVERLERGRHGRRVWTDRSARLRRDDFRRTHSITGRSADGGPLEQVPLLTNKKVLGPGYRFAFAGLPRERLPRERLRVRAHDRAGRRFCAIYGFARGARSSYAISRPRDC
ncbi:MAG TPA: hypothetical protein VF545_01725 [Thermoleophilaceae bacterium]|jgi:hypothetical protein